MDKQCYSCHAIIFLLQDKEGKWGPFNDADGNILHKCKSKNDDYHLLRETISRISALERNLAEIQSILKGVLK